MCYELYCTTKGWYMRHLVGVTARDDGNTFRNHSSRVTYAATFQVIMQNIMRKFSHCWLPALHPSIHYPICIMIKFNYVLKFSKQFYVLYVYELGRNRFKKNKTRVLLLV